MCETLKVEVIFLGVNMTKRKYYCYMYIIACNTVIVSDQLMSPLTAFAQHRESLLSGDHHCFPNSGAARGYRGHVPPIACRGPIGPAFLLFSSKFYENTFYHIFKMKWPKSEEKIEIEGP